MNISLVLMEDGSIGGRGFPGLGEDESLMIVPAQVFVLLNMFDESRLGFNWTNDCINASEITEIALNNTGWSVTRPLQLQSVVTKLCSPGAGFWTHREFLVEVQQMIEVPA